MESKKDFYKEFSVPDYPLSFDSEEERLLIKEEIHLRLLNSISSQEEATPKGIKKMLTLRTYRIAAFFVVATVFSLAGYKLYKSSNKSVQFITLNAPKGKVMEFLLPDNSKIVLNAGSRLKYPIKFVNTRDVYLEEGEAYFDVTHNPEQPFIVHANGLNTRVLGTAFSVKAYHKLPTITITVERGKVQVEEKAASLGILTFDKQLIFNKLNRTAVEKTVSSINAFAWKKGEIILTGAYFDEIMLTISNRFNVEIVYDTDKFKNCQNSIRFTQKQTLTEVLDVLKKIQGIKYNIENGKIYILGESCM